MTREQTVTTTPAALASITEGSQYSVQNRSPLDVYLAVASSVPVASDEAFVIPRLGFLYPKTGSGESIYVWVQDNTGRTETALVTYEETS